MLATPDGSGAIAAVIRSWGEPPDELRIAYIKVIAVHPDARRAGLGHELMAAAEEWAWAHGATEMHLSGSAPFYLWPGVDATATEMLCLAEARGYTPTGSDVNMALTTTFRGADPEGVTIRRVVTDEDVARLDELLVREWPEWIAETHRAIEHGCCHAAWRRVTDGGDGSGDGDGSGNGNGGHAGDVDGIDAGDAVQPVRGDDADREEVIGFACHSVNRAGWLGPMGTDPDRRATGVGSALLGQVCRDLMIAEYPHTEISWVGPVRFYAKNGATVSRVFRQYRKRRPR